MFKRHFWFYFIFCCTVAALVVVNTNLVRTRVRASAAYNHVINVAGGQRAIAQELARMSYEAYLGNPEANKMSQLLAQWDKKQIALQTGARAAGLDIPMDDGLIADYATIAPIYRKLQTNYRRIVASTSIDKKLLDATIVQEREYYRQMDRLVNNVEERAELYMASVEEDSAMMAWVSGIIIMLEVIIFVWPQHRMVSKTYEELKARKKEIELYRKQTEELNNTQGLMISGTNAGVWEWDALTNQLTWTDKVYQLLGYAPKEVTPSYTYFFEQTVHHEDREYALDELGMHLKTKKPFNIEARLRQKDGSYKWYSIAGSAVWDADGKPQRMAGSVIDIDESVNYRRQLEYNEFLLEETGNLAKVGGWEYDIRKDLYTWSKTMYEINGMEPGTKITLKERIKRYRPEDRRMLADLMNRAIHNGESYDLELMSEEKDGDVWARIIGIPVRDDQTGQVVMLRGVYQDITQHKLRELELESIKEKLSESNATKDKLFSILSHDLRSPINQMKSLIDMREDGLISQDEFAMYLAEIKQNVHYLSGAMDNMLYWAQSQMAGFNLKTGKVKMADSIEMAVQLYDNAFAQKNIMLINNADENHYALADKDHLFIIVRNLLNNALKFTPEGGLIRLQTKMTGNAATIAIQDTGEGMSAEAITLILNQSVLHTTRGTQGEKGTGLGLNLCLELAHKNGGEISIESQPGKGSTFTLKLPAAYSREGITAS